MSNGLFHLGNAQLTWSYGDLIVFALLVGIKSTWPLGNEKRAFQRMGNVICVVSVYCMENSKGNSTNWDNVTSSTRTSAFILCIFMQFSASLLIYKAIKIIKQCILYKTT